MSETVKIEQLRKDVLQCAICLETKINPKCLGCNHSYCKRCLDGLLEFDQIRKAKIKCPKCSKYTSISSTDTTNDLLTDYSASDLVDVISETAGPSSKSGVSKCDVCTGDVVKYCVFCKIFLCANCKDPHDDVKHSSEFLTFNKKEMNLSLYCKDHKTDITSVCCGKNVCVYCLKRQHKGHSGSQKLGEEEKSMKKQLTENIKVNANIKSRLLDINEKMINSEKELENVLLRRIEKCLSDFTKFLNDEADDIRRYFNSLTKDHFQQIACIQDNNAYFGACVSKTGLDFQLERKTIKRKLENHGTINKLLIKLTETKDRHPLGVLEHKSGLKLSPLSNETFISEVNSENINSSSIPLDHLKKVSDESCTKGAYEEHCLGKFDFSFNVHKSEVDAFHKKVKKTSIFLRGMWFEFYLINKSRRASVDVQAKSWEGREYLSLYVPIVLTVRHHNGNHLVKKSEENYEDNTRTKIELPLWSDMLEEGSGYAENGLLKIEVSMQADVLPGSPWDSKKLTGYVGLKRHKESCHVNSILQILFSLTKLRKVLISQNDDATVGPSNGNLMEIWQAVQQSFLKLNESMDSICVKGLHSLLNCSGKSSLKICQLLYQAIEKMSSAPVIISELFDGKMMSTLECSNVEHCVAKENSFRGIQLLVKDTESLEESIGNNLSSKALSLLSCAGVGKDCGNAGIKKGTIFCHLPPVLQFHLRSKLEYVLPNLLDLSTFLGEDVVSKAELSHYLLHSVLCTTHQNTALDSSSRFIAYISPLVDGNWLKFDDDIVSKVSEDEALQIISRKKVYMLTYIRKSDIGGILSNKKGKKRKYSKI